MPLDKSGTKKAFSANVAAEIRAGKPKAQALAIAYRVKRGRAFGGPVAGPIGPAGAPPPGAAGLPLQQPGSPAMGLSPAAPPPQMGVPQPMGVAGAMGGVPGNVQPGTAQGVTQLPPSAFPQFKRGGSVTPPPNDPFQKKVTTGALLSSVPGRTDAHFTHVPSGSYVIPADIVSGRGEGNTIAGAAALQKLFKMAPYGGAPMKVGKGPGTPGRGTLPHARKKKFAAGGAPDPNMGKPVRVNLAGGEIVVPPDNLIEAVHPDLKTAHEIMDKWVLDERKKLRKTLAKLPGPVKS